MDLNYLFYRHQISLFMSENAACQSSRLAHQDLAEAYASLISAKQPTREGSPS